MLPQFKTFVMNHWALAGGFVIVFIMLMIEEIRAQGPSNARLSTAAVTQLINREDAMVIDVRDATAFREGHIVNAKNIPLVDLDRHMEKLGSDRKRPLILVDTMGEKTSALMARFKKAEFEKVFALKGGIDAWKAASMPTVKGQK